MSLKSVPKNIKIYLKKKPVFRQLQKAGKSK